jgi:hypothetical protein
MNMPLQHRKAVDKQATSQTAPPEGQILGMSDESGRLIKWEELQPWQRNNPYIWGGYRRPSYSLTQIPKESEISS